MEKLTEDPATAAGPSGIPVEPASPSLQHIVNQAAFAGRMPYALITTMLGGRVRILAAHGIGTHCEAHLQEAFAHLIAQDGDVPFMQTSVGQIDGGRPLMLGPTLIRFLAAVPVHSAQGKPVATLIVMDDRPWAITGGLMGLLTELAQQAGPNVVAAVTALGFHLGDEPQRHLNEGTVGFRHDRIALATGLDELTGLPGPVMFRDRLGEALKRARRARQKAALVLVDLRGLDWVRQEHGKEAGDALLREFVRRLRTSRRETDTVARLRDDEFALIFEQLECEADAKIASMRLLEGLCMPLQYGTAVLDAVAELGVAMFPDDAQDMESLVRRAGEDLEKGRSQDVRHVDV